MDNEIKIKGTVAVLCPLIQGRSKSTGALWQSQVFVLDTGGRFSSKVPIKLFGETIEKFPLQLGQEVTAYIDLDGREYNGTWYPEVKAWKIEYSTGAAQA